jgi:hypothetical protein
MQGLEPDMCNLTPSLFVGFCGIAKGLGQIVHVWFQTGSVQKAKIRHRATAGLKTRLHTSTRGLEALRRE